VLNLKNVGFAYSEEFSLKNINFSVDQGELIAVVGKNGSGKTTLTRVIMALTKLADGQISWEGRDLVGSQSADLASLIGYVFQNPDLIFFHNTAEEEVLYGPRQLNFSTEKCQAAVSNAFAVMDLTGYEQHNPRLMTKGQKQRLAIACALAMEPKLYLLDEPTAGQDLPFRDRLMTMLRQLCEQGKSVMMVTHDMEVLQKYATRVLVLNQGSLVFDGPPAKLFQDPKQAADWGLKVPDAYLLSNGLENAGIQATGSLVALAEQIRLRREQL